MSSANCCNHGAWHMQPRMTMARTLKLYKLPEQTQTPGLRPLTKADIPQVGISAKVVGLRVHAFPDCWIAHGSVAGL